MKLLFPHNDFDNWTRPHFDEAKIGDILGIEAHILILEQKVDRLLAATGVPWTENDTAVVLDKIKRLNELEDGAAIEDDVSEMSSPKHKRYMNMDCKELP